MGNLWNNQTVTLLEHALGGSALRQRVIANNVANFNTPAFKKSQVNFESKLREALKAQEGLALVRTHAQHLMKGKNLLAVKPEVVRDELTTMRKDGNNVDLEKEMVNLITNDLYFNANIQFLNHQFTQLRTVISEGRR